jgi:uncharacterized protein (UPF0210 family)
MEIRTITAGAREDDLERAAKAAQLARARLADAGYTVQTLRLALAATGFNSCGDFATIARGVEQRALDAGFDYVSLGPVEGERLAALPEAIAATETVFASAPIALAGEVRPEVIHAAAAAIAAIGAGTPDGFGNLRFAASACVGPGSPFFPAAYHDGGAPWVAVGPEAAALAVEATTTDDRRPTTDDRRPTTNDARLDAQLPPLVFRPSSLVHPVLTALTALIERHDAQIASALSSLEAEAGVRFAGCDWSLAPHPDPARSAGRAAEALSGVPFGAWGTLAAVRGLTAAIRAAKVTQLGFSGVMLPVLEDETLARRNAEGRYTLRDLLAFSAVCGTGLDTIPMPGDAAPEQIAGVLAEVAALAAALRKPLTARLLPIPGLKAGDTTAFTFEYFVNTRVMNIA